MRVNLPRLTSTAFHAEVTSRPKLPSGTWRGATTSSSPRRHSPQDSRPRSTTIGCSATTSIQRTRRSARGSRYELLKTTYSRTQIEVGSLANAPFIEKAIQKGKSREHCMCIKQKQYIPSQRFLSNPSTLKSSFQFVEDMDKPYHKWRFGASQGVFCAPSGRL